MIYQLYSKEDKGDVVTLHLKPTIGAPSPWPSPPAWTRLWQASATAELQMDVTEAFAATLTPKTLFSLS